MESTPIMSAAQKGKTDKVNFLIERGANPNINVYVNAQSYITLSLAQASGHLDIVKLLK